MMLYTPQKTRRAAPSPARRSWRRPLLLERLEDRVVPAIPDGTLLVATFPDPTATRPLPPAGIIGVNPITGTQFPVSTRGLFSKPTYITEAPNGQLYVTDIAAFGGAVIQVDPNTGNQTLRASGRFLTDANVIAFVNGFLYVASESRSGTIHNLVQVNPVTGGQKLITSGGGGKGFTFATGMIPVPGRNAVYISDEQGSADSPPPLGMIWKVDLTTGVQTPISSNGSQGMLFDHPTDLALEPSGSLIVTNVGDRSNNHLGSLFRVNPANGVQSRVDSGVSFGTFSGLNSDVVRADGTIFVGHIPGNLPPLLTGGVIAVNPVTGARRPITSAKLLSSVEGMRFFHAVALSADTPPVLSAPPDQSATEDASQAFSLASFIDPVSNPFNVDVKWGDGEARIASLEMAFRMQSEAQEAFDIGKESGAIRRLYDDGEFANACLIARRLAERGVRVTQIYYGNGQPWDDHNNI